MAGYKFRGVPKTFRTKEQALAFLRSSPGYVSRQSTYLQQYWPKLAAEVGADTIAKEATAYAAPRTIFIPPALTGGKTPARKSPKPPSRPTAPALEADYQAAVNRREVSLGLPAKGRVEPNIADAVPAPILPAQPRVPGARGPNALLPEGSGLGKTVAKTVGKIGQELGERAIDYSAGDLLRDVDRAGDAVRRGFTPRDYRGDLSKGNILGTGSMPFFDWLASEKGANDIFGESLVNAFQHPLRPVGLTGAAAIAAEAAMAGPVGRSTRAGVIMSRGIVRDVPRLGQKQAVAALKLVDERIALVDDQIGKMSDLVPADSPSSRRLDNLLSERANLTASKQALEARVHPENVTPPAKKRPNAWKREDARRTTALDNLLWAQRPRNISSPFKAERAALAKALRLSHGSRTNALPARMKGRNALDVFALIDHLANVGARGRFWYSESAKGILELFGGDKMEARKLAALIAIYSPQRAVVPNIGIAKSALDEFYKTGAISIGDANQIRKATAVMEHGDTAWEGRKTGNFYANLLRYIDHDQWVADKFTGDEVTADMWMSRLFGYKTDTVSDGRYDVIQAVLRQIAKEKGWQPDEVQAATWVAIKDLDPWDVSANVDFEGAIGRNLSTVNLETTRGISGIGSDLTIAEADEVNRELEPWIVSAAERLGITIRTRRGGPGGVEAIREGRSAYQAGRNASIHFETWERPEVVRRLTDLLARAFDQYEVWATKPGAYVGGKLRPGIHFTAPELDNPEVADRFFEHLNAKYPKGFQGFMPYRDGGGITIVSVGSKTNPELPAWAQSFHDDIAAAADAAGISRIQYEAENIGIIVGEGGANGGSGVLGSAGELAGRTLDDQLAAEGRDALNAAVGRVQAARSAAAAPAAPASRGLTIPLPRPPSAELGATGWEDVPFDLRPRVEPVSETTEIARAGAARVGEGAPLAPGAAGPPDLLDAVSEAVQGAKPVREAQEAGYTVERGRRIAQAMDALETIGGVEGKAAAAKALKGELPKLDWNGFAFLDQESYGALIDHVVKHADLRPWEKIRTIWGLERAMTKGVPTRSEIALFERAFGKPVADNLGNPENMGILELLHRYGLQVWNVPRTLMASFDLSAPFRQGLVAGARHPVVFAKNFMPMVRAFGREEAYLAVMDDIATRPNFPLYEKARLAITDVKGSAALREEQFPGSVADELPGVKHSSRAYSAFLNKMRVDVFDQMIELAASQGKNVEDPEFLDALGRYINASTGRGKLPWKAAESAAPFLNSFLFSPRLMASRIAILNPVYYVNLYRQSPFVARQAALASLNTLAGISTMLYLASNISGVKVGMNPLSADFGKIRIRDTRIDIAGGFQAYLVLYARLLQGKSVSSSSGKQQDLKGGFGSSSRKDVLQRFVEGKFAPTAGMIRDALAGQTFIGEPITPGGMAWNNLTPLNLQGALDVYGTEGSIPAAAAGAALGSIGFGVGSYPDRPQESSSSSGSRSSSKPGARGGLSRKPSGRTVSSKP